MIFRCVVLIYYVLPPTTRSIVRRSFLGRKMRLGVSRFVGDQAPQALAIMSGPMKGMAIHTDLKNRSRYYSGKHEPEVVSTLLSVVKTGMTAIDIGANHGYLTILLAKLVGPQGTVCAFEPEPDNYNLLRRTIRANELENVEAYQLAVAGCGGTRTLYLGTDFGGTHSLVNKKSKRSIEVESVALDDFVASASFKSVDIIKIDVEGGELGTLNGMQHTLNHFKPMVICEFHSRQLLSDGCALLEERGYEITVVREECNVQVLATQQAGNVETQASNNLKGPGYSSSIDEKSPSSSEGNCR